MGYRSEVRCLIYGDPGKLQALITKHQLEGGKIFEPAWFGTNLRRYKAERQVYNYEKSVAAGSGTAVRAVWATVEVEVLDLYGGSWKWYETYEDVITWHRFMQEAEELFGLDYEFIRIGEEPTDVQVERSANDEQWLRTVTSITCDVEARGDDLPM